ncbi:unnamed protein product [Arabidopsis halleri]
MKGGTYTKILLTKERRFISAMHEFHNPHSVTLWNSNFFPSLLPFFLYHI